MEEEKIKILIIDDDMYVRMVVKAYLAPYNTEAFETKDGRKALQIMKNEGIDLVIVDYHMPIMGGQEVLDIMMADKTLSKIPTIVYTSGEFSIDVEERLKQSSTAFLKKTEIGDELIPLVKNILGSRLKKIV